MENAAQFMQEIVCPSCASQGHATWQAGDRPGGLRHLVTLSDGFKMSSAQDGQAPIMFCKSCGTTQPDQRDVGA